MWRTTEYTMHWARTDEDKIVVDATDAFEEITIYQDWDEYGILGVIHMYEDDGFLFRAIKTWLRNH